MPRVIHFEIHADDPERVVNFYKKLFDWKISKWDGPVEYWRISTGKNDEPGINGGNIIRKGKKYKNMAVIGYVCTVEVNDIDNYINKALELGATIALPKNLVQGVGYQIYFKDTERNIFGIHQPESNPI